MRKLLILLSLLISLGAMAQPPYDLTSKDKKAIKSYKAGEECFKNRDLDCAVKNLKAATERDPLFLEPYLLMADAQIEQRKPFDAIATLKKVLEINPTFYPTSFFLLGQLEIKNGLYEDAKLHYQEYLKGSRINPEMGIIASNDIENCHFAIEAMKNPVPFDPKNLGGAINTKDNEYFPCVTADNETILYTRLLESSKSMDGRQEDFFISFKKDGQWGLSRNIGPPINSYMNEGAPTLSPDGQLIIFTACEIFGEYGTDRRGYGSCDLFVTKRIGEQWVPPGNLGQPVNTAHWETQPSWSSDGKTMYFIRGLKTRSGIKDQDIWMATLNDQGDWTMPRKLGPEINTSGAEESVFIHPDGNTLYFASDGHTGMGGSDLFVARRQPNGKWGTPENLGYPINTYNDENSVTITADGKLAYFASDREGGQGGLDLYQFELPENLRPTFVTYMKGKVYNADNKKPLEAKFQLIDLETGEPVVESYSNRGNGEFILCVPTNKNYALNVQKKGYMYFSETFELVEAGTETEPYRKDVPLIPIKENTPVVLKNVFFDTDKYNLKPKSKVELDKLAEYLKKLEYPKIELGGHTDNVGDGNDNLLLSQNRANSVMTYLVSAGVPKESMTAKGYGEGQPKCDNETDEGRACNRRTEYKFLQLK